MYRENARRAGAMEIVADMDAYLASLEMQLRLRPFDKAGRARIVQLINKSNQFNLTTRRYTEQQIARLAECPGWRVWSLRVRDRYADNGLVGVAISHLEGEVCEIDSFLLSCRVIGRTVETALLAHLASDARVRGAQRLQGWFLPTQKNAPAREFYREHGFEAGEPAGDGVLWILDLTAKQIRTPDWIHLA